MCALSLLCYRRQTDKPTSTELETLEVGELPLDPVRAEICFGYSKEVGGGHVFAVLATKGCRTTL